MEIQDSQRTYPVLVPLRTMAGRPATMARRTTMQHLATIARQTIIRHQDITARRTTMQHPATMARRTIIQRQDITARRTTMQHPATIAHQTIIQRQGITQRQTTIHHQDITRLQEALPMGIMGSRPARGLGLLPWVTCCIWCLSVPLGIVSIVLGILQIQKKTAKGMAIAGIVCSVIGILLTALISIYAGFIQRQYMDSPMYNEILQEIMDEMYDY